MSSGDMSISAFAKRSLLSVKALRLYDEMGLLRPERVDPSSGYRYYVDAQLETARLISLLRRLDVPLADIAVMIAQEPDDTSRSLTEWWQREEERMAGRRDLFQYIRGAVLASSAPADQTYDVQMRNTPPTTFIFRSRHIHGPEIASFIGRSFDELMERANLYGGVSGHGIVVYHGVVDFDSDGPVDVCLPISGDSVPQGNDRIRTEAEHQQVFTVLRKHQVAFPQILQVYHALRRWIAANDYVISGPPRERYLGDFSAAGPDDAICEVAFPVLWEKGTTNE